MTMRIKTPKLVNEVNARLEEYIDDKISKKPTKYLKAIEDFVKKDKPNRVRLLVINRWNHVDERVNYRKGEGKYGDRLSHLLKLSDKLILAYSDWGHDSIRDCYMGRDSICFQPNICTEELKIKCAVCNHLYNLIKYNYYISECRKIENKLEED